MLVVVNVTARGGRARRRWPRVQAALEAAGLELAVRETTSAAQARDVVERAWVAGERRFVAAGGDGTVNALLNLLRDAGFAEAELGAVGLGSSNDFHKPLAREHVLAGCPIRVGAPRAVDVGRARFVDEGGEEHERRFLINASLGITASANGRFNAAGRGLSALKRVHVELAILACAGDALARFRAVPLQLSVDGRAAERLSTTNLAVLKRVHVSGGMRYDTPVGLDDGQLAVNWVGDVGRWRLVRAVLNLYRGRFKGTPGTESWLARTAEVSSEAPTWLELDGEVARAARVRFDVEPRGIQLCAPGWSA